MTREELEELEKKLEVAKVAARDYAADDSWSALMDAKFVTTRRIDMYIFLSGCTFAFFVVVGYLIGISL